MREYDPRAAPDPAAWLALDEQERLVLIEKYHLVQKFDLPDTRLHAIIHTIVENQIAEGHASPVREKGRQLMAQGLSRHDAIHAIGSVLAGHMNDLAEGKFAGENLNRRYFSKLRRLTAQRWLRSG